MPRCPPFTSTSWTFDSTSLDTSELSFNIIKLNIELTPAKIHVEGGFKREGELESLTEVLGHDYIRINAHNASGLMQVEVPNLNLVSRSMNGGQIPTPLLGKGSRPTGQCTIRRGGDHEIVQKSFEMPAAVSGLKTNAPYILRVPYHVQMFVP